MGAFPSKKASGLKEAQYRHLTIYKMRQMYLERQEIKAQAEKDSMLSKYTKNYNPPLL